MGFTVQGAPAGEGMLDIPLLMRCFSHLPMNAVLEQWTPPQDDLEQTVALEEDWAAKGVKTLSRLLKS